MVVVYWLMYVLSIQMYSKVQRETTLTELAPSPLFGITNYCPIVANVFAKFDEFFENSVPPQAIHNHDGWIMNVALWTSVYQSSM